MIHFHCVIWRSVREWRFFNVENKFYHPRPYVANLTKNKETNYWSTNNQETMEIDMDASNYA